MPAGKTGGPLPAGGKPDKPDPKETKPEPKAEAKPAETAAPAGGSEKEFNRGAASAALGGAAGAARSCKKPDGPTGSGKVKVTLAPSGNVTSAAVVGAPFAGTSVGGCVASAFRSAKVPAFSGSPVSVTKSFSITSASLMEGGRSTRSAPHEGWRQAPALSCREIAMSAAGGGRGTNAQAEVAGIAPEPLFGSSDDAESDADTDDDADGERAAAGANVWIEQPTIGEIGVVWPPRQTVLEVDLDPALATPAAMVTLQVDGMPLWHGSWSETLHVALPEGQHRVSLAMVAPGVVGRRLARVETRVKCRQRVTAWNDHGALRLQHEDECAR